MAEEYTVERYIIPEWLINRTHIRDGISITLRDNDTGGITVLTVTDCKIFPYKVGANAMGWNADEVAGWLGRIGLGQYIASFATRAVDGTALVENNAKMTDAALAERFGMTDESHTRKLRREVVKVVGIEYDIYGVVRGAEYILKLKFDTDNSQVYSYYRDKTNKYQIVFEENPEWALQIAKIRVALGKGISERLGGDSVFGNLSADVVDLIGENIAGAANEQETLRAGQGGGQLFSKKRSKKRPKKRSKKRPKKRSKKRSKRKNYK